MRPILLRESGAFVFNPHAGFLPLMKKTALIQNLKNALASVLSLFLGVHAVMFLTGMTMLYFGLAGLWSRYGALTVCGGILTVVAIFSAAAGVQKESEA